MIRAAVLVSGDGARLQSVLDAIYFNELPDMQLVAVISSRRDASAMKRAINAGVPAYVVDPELFPNTTSHSMAVANKLRDMDIDLVLLAGYDMPLGVIPYQYKNRIIGTVPTLIPAFEDAKGEYCRAALERGVKITGASSYFAGSDGGVGLIIEQKSIDIRPEDTAESLSRRVLEECEWKLLPHAAALYCSGSLEVRGKRVVIK